MQYRPAPGANLTDVTVDFVYMALKASSDKVYGILVEGTYAPVERPCDKLGVSRILTEREREVLGWIALGKTAGETGTILGLSKRTIETHVYSAARKLDTANSTQTVVEAIRRGELEL
jgi:DNA-binding CsgD family transcriptional regulator